MLFNSFGFLLFFPITVLVYFLLPHRVRKYWLLGASAWFYMAFIPYYIIFLFPAILASYMAALAIARSPARARKILWLTSATIIVMGTLFIFKYYNFFAANISALFHLAGSDYQLGLIALALPLGISFHSFQAVSYLVDVYKGEKPEKDFAVYSLFILFFPQLVAGPIERAAHMIPQFHRPHHFNYEDAVEGLKMMLWGFFKKAVVADRLAVYADAAFNHPADYHGASLMVAAFFFSFQIYCDFSGYTDIALGSARCMGFELTQNFNRPYRSASVAEFWTRWNMTLYSWFRDYIYIPLGGSHVSQIKKARNILVVFALSGLWHGANWTFVVWGLLNAAYIILGISLLPVRRKIANSVHLFSVPRLHTFFRIICTFLLVTLAWIFFRAHSLPEAVFIISHLISPTGDSLDKLIAAGTQDDFILCFIAIAMLELFQYGISARGMGAFLVDKPVWLRWSFFYGILFMVVFFGKFDNRTFIYFQF